MKTIIDILKNNIRAENYKILEQFIRLEVKTKEALERPWRDLSYAFEVPERKKNLNIDIDTIYGSLTDFLESWLVKIADIDTVPLSDEDPQTRSNKEQKLRSYDNAPIDIISRIRKSSLWDDHNLDRLILIAAFRPREFINSTKYWSIEDIEKSKWYISVFEALLYDPSGEYLVSRIKMDNIKFGIIPIIPVKNLIDIENKAKKPLAVDLENINEEHIKQFIDMKKDELASLDLHRIIFIDKNREWPQYWLPSKWTNY